ncbi:MAG: hypothetical protein V2J55_18045 [Candidatus Competibacteraceae bacterium]|nr:hypothetical protein [Candidatus Competibacteraceae bacterium]
MIVRLPVPPEALYLLIQKIDGLVQEHNRSEPEAFMPKVAADEHYRGTPDWSLALEWRTRQGVASFNLHADNERVCMTYIYLREAVTAELWASTLHHKGKSHWNTVIDFIANLGQLGVWNYEMQGLLNELNNRSTGS